MGYKFEVGDRIRVTYDADGEEKTLDTTVEYNTTQMDPDEVMGSPKAKLRTSKKRTGIDVILWPDGSVRVRPRFNSNGAGEDGMLVDLEEL